MFYDWQGEHIVTTMTNFGDDGTPQNVAMTRRVLHRALQGAATRAGTVFRMATTIDSFADRGDGVDVQLSEIAAALWAPGSRLKRPWRRQANLVSSRTEFPEDSEPAPPTADPQPS